MTHKGFEELMSAAQEVKDLEKHYEDGLVTEIEAFNKMVDVMATALTSALKEEDQPGYEVC